MPVAPAAPAAPAAPVGQPQQAIAKGVWIMQCSTNESYNVPFYRKVLFDSGANGVIRPYNHQ
eukprot:9158211-Lingulodinium_polyedra.AAC.1